MPSIESGRVCIYGAGGPVAAAATQSLKKNYELRLTDLKDVKDILKSEPQSKGAPMPELLNLPHEWRCVDVTNYDQVRSAAIGMDALINATVIRPDPILAFHVNLIGAYNVMKAAVECGIKRIIHTGPRHTMLNHESDYWYDFNVSDDAPLHPGTNLYALTKYLGGNIVRIFAEAHSLEVVTFLYCGFNPGDGGDLKDGSGIGPFYTSWEDTGEAFRYGLRTTKLTQPYEVFDICADLPHGKFSPAKAQRLLGWKPKYNFQRLYTSKTKKVE